MRYDAIIVGARCAGAPTGMLLARAGLKVLIVDRAEPASDILNGHFIKDAGVRRLQRWGLLDELLATGCPRIPTRIVDFGVQQLASPPIPDGEPTPLAPRRFVLDDVLVRAAANAGADIRTQTSVRALRWDGERVVGIEYHDKAGHTGVEHAHLVVGADGRHSRTARMVGAQTYHATPALTLAYWAYWSDIGYAGLFLQPGLAAGLFPTHDGQALAFVQAPIAQRTRFQRDPEGSYLQALRSFPGIGDRFTAAERVSRVLGMVDLPNFFRVPYGPGWALVGDAGHHKDPLVARGIVDAFRDADLLAAAIVAGLGGQTALTAAMRSYHQQRDGATMLINDLNVRLAKLPTAIDEIMSGFQELLAAEIASDATVFATQ